MQENAALKLQLFWKDHNLEKLKNAMVFANLDSGPHCKCLACSVTGRNPASFLPPKRGCTFKPWFENHLMTLEMQTARVEHDENSKPHICINGNLDDNPMHSVIDHDSHICHFSGRDDWFWFTYGAKLWKAKSVNDPELQKLKSLFTILYRESSTTDEDLD